MMTPDEVESYKEIMAPFPDITNPMEISFTTDSEMARLICNTHKFIDRRTGEELVNPDGSKAIITANEETGLIRYYKTKPGVDRPQKYLVFASTGREMSRWERKIRRFFGIPADLVAAKGEYFAPVQFVPREGFEDLAWSVRYLYAKREDLMERSYRIMEEKKEPTGETLNGLLDQDLKQMKETPE